MTPVPIWRARVDDHGQLVLSDTERTERRTWLRSLAGKEVDVIVRRRRRQRTLAQNNYIHPVPVRILAEHFGYGINEMKLVLMGECWGWKKDKLTGHDIPVNAHTSEMTVEESTYFIEWVIPWAMMNHQVVIPYPNEVEA